MHNFFLWSREDRIFWYEMFLAELTMMRFAKTFVGTGTSNVWQLVRVLRDGEKIETLDKKRVETIKINKIL